MYIYVCAQSLSRVQLFATPWTVTLQVPLSMGFSRQEYQNGLPYPSPGDLPDPGIEPTSLTSPAFAGAFSTTRATWEGYWGPHPKSPYQLKLRGAQKQLPRNNKRCFSPEIPSVLGALCPRPWTKTKYISYHTTIRNLSSTHFSSFGDRERQGKGWIWKNVEHTKFSL